MSHASLRNSHSSAPTVQSSARQSGAATSLPRVKSTSAADAVPYDANTAGPETAPREHRLTGVDAPWYEKRELTDEQRKVFRATAQRSAAAKRRAEGGSGPEPVHAINVPRLRPETLMPVHAASGLRALSLFSGGGGLDLGFDRAGYAHVASFEVLDHAAETLVTNRPDWDVRSGDAGDVTEVKWSDFASLTDVVHGGPPCQPFSVAGRQRGADDARDMVPEFVRCVREIRPRAFVAENVAALGKPKFADYVRQTVFDPLEQDYSVCQFELAADAFGVPQARRRVFFVGLRRDEPGSFVPPPPTHCASRLSGRPPSLDSLALIPTMGTREALGLADIGFDALAPTLRSGLTGPRKTTSILNSTSAKLVWDKLGVWPNGVARSREAARAFVPDNEHFRLAVADCAVLQGFPEDWHFPSVVYKAIGQIGNSVAPPMGYNVATSIRRALQSDNH